MLNRLRLGLIMVSGLALGAPMPNVHAFGFQSRPDWTRKRGAIKFIVNMANVPATFPQEQYLAFLRGALEPWTQIATAAVPVAISDRTIQNPAINAPQEDGVNMIIWNAGTLQKEERTWGRAFSFQQECDVVLELTAPFTLANVRNTLTHEFGHCLGLAHSTAMASMARYSHYLAVLTQDDVAATSILFPNPDRPLDRVTATLKGRVVRRNGDPVVGAVLSVVQPGSPHAVLSGFSGLVDGQRRLDTSGAFELPGVPPGRHQLVIQPLARFGGADDGHHGIPTDDPPIFTPLTVELPELDEGDVKDLGRLVVEE